MNFKIQQTYPSPSHGLSSYNTLTYGQCINSFVLYGQQQNSTQGASTQPKKKIAFKVQKLVTTPVIDKISVFSVEQRKWSIVQAKGKIPTPRSQFKSIYMKPCIIIYGGKVNGKYVNQVYALNCETWIWKKLFSLDGPTLSQDNIFFKISDITAGLLVSGSLWLLQLADVKWQLSANQLPGSVWEKVSNGLPENIQFCIPLNQQLILVVGIDKVVKLNIKTKQKISQFQYKCQNQLSKFYSQGRLKLTNSFCQTNEGSKMSFIYLVSSDLVQILNYRNNKVDLLGPISQNQQKYEIKLDRSLKCCAYSSIDSKYKSIYYIDNKGQFLSIDIKLDTQSLDDEIQNGGQQVTTRRIDCQSQNQNENGSDGGNDNQDANNHNMLRNNSCILQQQQNQQSSLLVPSSNSRIKIESNSRIQVNNKDSQNDLNFANQDGYNNWSQQPQNLQSFPQNSKMTILHQHQANSTNIHKSKNKDEEQTIKNNFQNNQKRSKPQMHVSTGSNKRNIYNINNSQTNPVQKIGTNNQRFKYKTEEHTQQKHSYRHSHNYNKKGCGREASPQASRSTEQLKQKLENILYNETIKRKLLEAKCSSLQNIIKKSQRFVLMLCKYGNNEQKQRHIQKVRQIRQQLEWNWNKQVYYKKEMEGNKMPSQISHQIQKTMSHIQY